MRGPQDLGGRHGFGPVAPEPGEPVFHAPWERRALALTLAAGALGHWTLDESRHARESLPPATYYAASYYEIWLRALETLLLRHGLVTEAELAAGAAEPAPPHPRRLPASIVPETLARGGPSERDPGASRPGFGAGDRVRTRLINPAHHSRLPGYALGRPGTIESAQGFHVFPDASAHGLGEAPQWLYTVVFRAVDLWGDDADPAQSVSIDAWESYLEPA
ncbi:nitrile hydratase subunit beta [soil metagenome]